MWTHQLDHADNPLQTTFCDGTVQQVLIAEAKPASLAGVLHPFLAVILCTHRHPVEVGVGFQPGMMRLDVSVLGEAEAPVTDLVVVGVHDPVVGAERLAAVDTDTYGLTAAATAQEAAT